METLNNYIEKFFYNYGFYIIGGAIGAIIHRMRVKMSPIRFLKYLVIAIILGLSAGIICRDVIHLPETTTYVICGIFGAFAEEILDELEDLIKNISEIAKKKLGGIDELPKINNTEEDEKPDSIDGN